jgi:competence protein ComEC
MKILGVVGVILLLSQPLAFEGPEMFVVWNVGQGQWVTLINRETCIHFDMGGEQSKIGLSAQHCRNKSHRVWLSHDDWDHINFLGSGRSQFPDLCLMSVRPIPRSWRKRKLLNNIADCTDRPRDINLELIWQSHDPKASSNDRSLVALSYSVLIPGDSLAAQEHKWSLHPHLRQVQTLIVGHHGSRTSTSKFLLDRLPSLTQAIASSRRSRYGHPHFEVEVRLRRKNIPLVSTEDWGNIRLDL